ncbi:MAG: hypothetical protein Q7S14_00605 [bacterium]|nr:hypothetical protein [bacterium]
MDHWSLDGGFIPKTGSYSVNLYNVNLKQELVTAYSTAKKGDFVYLKPGDLLGTSNGEVKAYVIRDGQIDNPLSFFSKVPTRN